MAIRSVGVWAVLCLLAGCGGGTTAGEPDAEVGLEQCTPGGTFNLDGRVGVLANLNVHVNASGLVEVDTTADLLLLMDIAQDGTDVGVTATLCSIQIPDVPVAGQDMPIHFEIKPETIASVGTVAGTASLSSPDQACASFTSERFTIVIGALLDPIDTAMLPAADNDGDYTFCPPTAATSCALAIGVNCACDQESDGLPGATLLASNVPAVNLDEVYVAIRTQFTLDGTVHDSDLIIGEIDATLEQGVLGCHIEGSDACSPAQVNAVKNLNPMVTQQPGNPSAYRAVGVADILTCAELVAMKDDLFPR